MKEGKNLSFKVHKIMHIFCDDRSINNIRQGEEQQ